MTTTINLLWKKVDFLAVFVMSYICSYNVQDVRNVNDYNLCRISPDVPSNFQ